MLDFLSKFFKPERSSSTAKERLRLVLLSDRISLAPDVIEALKVDLLEVISRYVEVDESHTEINFEHRESEVAMLANIPILALRPRPPAPPKAPEPEAAMPPPLTPQPAAIVAVEETMHAAAPGTGASGENRAARRRRQRATQKPQPNLGSQAAPAT